MRKWVLLLCVCLCVSLGHAKTVSVSPDGTQPYTNIRTAIEQTISGDTIILFPGTYRGIDNCGIDVSARHIQSTCPTDPNCVKATVIDCETVFQSSPLLDDGSAFYLFRGGFASISGLTFTHLNSSGSGVINTYGYNAIPCSLKIIHCTFINNKARRGGALTLGPGSSSITNTVSIRNSLFIGNTASEMGGAIYSNAQTSIECCLFQGNVAPQGSALHSSFQNPTLSYCTFVGNITNGEGPTITNDSFTMGNTTLDHCIFWDNFTSQENSNAYEPAKIGGAMTVLNSCCLPPEFETNNTSVATIHDSFFADPRLVRNPSDGGDGWLDNPQTPELDESANNDYGDWHLTVNSPCIDMGDPNALNHTILLDTDSQARITGASIDMGCDEYPTPSTLIVAPKSVQTWALMSSQNIEWKSLANNNPVNLELGQYVPISKPRRTLQSNSDIDNDYHWRILEANLPPSGTISCQIPTDLLSTKCLVRAVIQDIPNDSQYNLPSPQIDLTLPADNPLQNDNCPWQTNHANFQRTSGSVFNGPTSSLSMSTLPIFDTSHDSITYSGQTGIAIGSNNTIYIPHNNLLYGYQLNEIPYTPPAHSLSLLWTYQANATITCAPIIGLRGQLYFGDEAGTLYALNPDGKLAWTYSTQASITSSPAMNDNEDIFFGSINGQCYALSQNGSLLWHFQTENSTINQTAILSSLSMTSDGLIVTGAFHSPTLYALNPTTGMPVWTHTFASDVYPVTDPVVSDPPNLHHTLQRRITCVKYTNGFSQLVTEPD